MIDSRIYIKSLNATEAGETNTNDSYILIPKGFDANDFFGLTEENRKFFDAIDPESNKKYNLRYEITKTGEQRIYKLGVYCRDNDLHAGDTICLEHLNIDGESSFIIRHRRMQNILLLQKLKGDYIFSRNDIGDSVTETPIELLHNGSRLTLSFKFKERAAKKNNSPDKYDIYEAVLSTGQKLSEIVTDKYVIIDTDNKIVVPFGQTKEYHITQE